MLHALAILAASEAGGEPSKTAFYILGGVLAAWAVVLTAIGMSRATFPQTKGQARGVMAISALLVAGAMAAAVATSYVDDADDGHAISFKVLRRGTPVIAADGVRLGTVRRVHEATRENLFDGIDVDTPRGVRFLDAPEVARIAERAVTATFPSTEAEQHLVDRGSATVRRLAMSRTVRRARRAGRGWLDRWDRR